MGIEEPFDQKKLRLETEKLESEIKWSKGIRRFLGPSLTVVISASLTFLLTYFFVFRPDLERQKKIELERKVQEFSGELDAAPPGKIETLVLQLLLKGDPGRKTLAGKIDSLDHNPSFQLRIVKALKKTGPVGEDFYVRLLGRLRNNPSWFGNRERLILAYELHTALAEIGSKRAQESIAQFFEYEAEKLKEMQKARKAPLGMVYVPAGPFLMGEDPPSVEVTEGFFIDQFEVSNAQYKEIVKEHTFQREEAKRPVINLTMAEAADYCKRRNKRVPSEKQWEKAVRGIYGRLYPWGNSFAKGKARIGLERKDGAVDVDILDMPQEDKSPYGVYHMSGNVRERTQGYVRGGSWNDNPSLARTSSFSRIVPEFSSDIIGFRCSKVVTSSLP